LINLGAAYKLAKVGVILNRPGFQGGSTL